jgi:hypothetical protein
MKNKLSDLNDHLFAQLERLSDEDMVGEKLDQEVARGKAIVAVSDQIIQNANLTIQAAKILSDHGLDPTSYLAFIERKSPAQSLQVIEGRKS